MSDAETVPKPEQYRQWLGTAVSIVEEGNAPLSDVSSEHLPASDKWLRHAVKLHIEAEDEDPDVDSRRPWTRTGDVDWMGLWAEFSFDDPGPFRKGHGVSMLQAAGALASSERTPRGWDLQPCKDRINDALDAGDLVDVKAQMDTEDVVIVPAEVVNG